MRAGTLAIIAMLGLAGTTPAAENLVYRCKDASSGHLSFQSQPCGRDQVQEATYDATPDEASAKPDPGKKQPGAAPTPRRKAGGGRRTPSGPGAVAAVIGSSAECKRLRAARDKAYRADFKMGYRERQKWGDRVRKACR